MTTGATPTFDPALTPAYPPPPGVTPDFDSTDNAILGNYIAHAILLACTTTAVAIRLYTRRFLKNYMGWDDCFVALSWAFVVSFSAQSIANNVRGFGQHIWNVPLSKFDTIGKGYFDIGNVYIAMLITIKVSILLTYKRIFGPGSKVARILIWAGIVCDVIFYLIMLLLSVLWCRPMAKIWNPAIEGTCAPYDLHYSVAVGSGVFNVTTDFYILALPMPFVWRLQMDQRRKYRLIAIFGLGLVTCICSILRLWAVKKNIWNPDLYYYAVKYLVFVLLEVHIGLICCCALVFPAFFDPATKGSFGSFLSKFQSSHGTNVTGLSSESGTELQSKENPTFFHSIGDGDSA